LDTPKVLFPVAGKPIVGHAIDAVAKVKTVKEIYLIGFYENNVFDEFIAQAHKEHPHVSVKYLREYKAMGTAGGLYHFRDVILKGKPDNFYVIHADVCSSFPLVEISEFFASKKDARAVILGTRVPAKIANNFGAIVANEDSKVIHYVEKPEGALSTLVNAGVYLFDQSLFDAIAEAKAEREEHARGAIVSDEGDEDTLRLEQDVLTKYAEGGHFYVYETKDFWRQIKEAGSAIPANSLYLQKLFQTDPKAPGLAQPSANIVPPVFVDPSASVDPTAKLGPDVSIGANVRIGPGARIKDAIVLDNVEVKANATVLHSILCNGAKIGRWARIEGSPTDLNSYSSSTVKDGVRVQTVTILANNVSVADEVHVQNTIVLPHKELKSDVKNEVIM
jgi:mannose-1-phosphate guanylyltransferase